MLGYTDKQAFVFEEEINLQEQESSEKVKLENDYGKQMQSGQPQTFCLEDQKKNEFDIELKSKPQQTQLDYTHWKKSRKINEKQSEVDIKYSPFEDNDLSGLSTLDVQADPLKPNHQSEKDKEGSSVNRLEELLNQKEKISENDESERQDGMKIRKEEQKFKDISMGFHVDRVSHTCKQKTESKYEARNIAQGLFQGENANQIEPKIIERVESDPVKERPNCMKEEGQEHKPNARRLPPIMLNKQVKVHEENGRNVIAEHNTSSLALERQVDRRKYHQQHHNNDALRLVFRTVPEGKIMKCKFRRYRNFPQNIYHSQYSLFLKTQVFLINSKKQWGHINSHYNLSCQPKNYSTSSELYAGFLKANFAGTCFNIFSIRGQKYQMVATIMYKAGVMCSSSFRSIEVYIKNERVPYSDLEGAIESQSFNLQELFEIGGNSTQRRIIKIVSKKPEWSEQHGCYAMNFKGHSKMASVKNFILVQQRNERNQVLLICKREVNEFYMEIGYPLNPLIGFGIVLSSFDFKLLCQ